MKLHPFCFDIIGALGIEDRISITVPLQVQYAAPVRCQKLSGSLRPVLKVNSDMVVFSHALLSPSCIRYSADTKGFQRCISPYKGFKTSARLLRKYSSVRKFYPLLCRPNHSNDLLHQLYIYHIHHVEPSRDPSRSTSTPAQSR